MSNLKNYFLVGLIASLLLTLVLLNRAYSSLAEKTAEIEAMRIVAQSYNEKSETIAKETGNAFTVLVEQIKDKDLALQNAKARFGSCNAARGIRAEWVRAKDGVGEAYVPGEPRGPSESELIPVDAAFINACATDSAFVGAVQEWRIANDLPVQ